MVSLLCCTGVSLLCTAVRTVLMGAAPWRPVSYPLQECSPSTSVFSKNRFRINREIVSKNFHFFGQNLYRAKYCRPSTRVFSEIRCGTNREIFLEISTFDNIFGEQLFYCHLASASSKHIKRLMTMMPRLSKTTSCA